MQNYLAQIREHLQSARQAKREFDDAWAEALRISPPPHPLWTERMEGVESPLMTAHRYMEIAYYGGTLPGPHYSRLEPILSGGDDG